MKIIISFIGIASILFGIIACQKEINFPNDIAKGSLKVQNTNDCLSSSVSGNYKKDSGLNASHYIDVQVQITSAGFYQLHSDTISGFYFRAQGNVTDTGLKTIRLQGSGIPSAAGLYNFSIYFGNSQCLVPVLVTQSQNNTTAIFTLGMAGNNCTGVTLNGNYIAGVAMTNQNSVVVNVNVTVIGSYDISTPTVNGVGFSARGLFTNTGNQQLTLNANGTPATAGNFDYPINSGVPSPCRFTVTFTGSSSQAVYTTLNNSGQCNPITINGTYKVGVPMTGTNTIIVQVNVTTPGSYSMTTAPAVDGIVFNAAGTFSTTGTFNVTMYGIGTPLLAGTYNFTIAGASGCTFPLTIQTTGGSSTGIFTCKINGVFTTFNINAYGHLSFPSSSMGQALELKGKATDSTAENLYLVINRYQQGSLIIPGNYGLGSGGGNFTQCYYGSPTGQFWYGTNTSITVTTVTSSRITGTFYGSVRDGGGWGSNTKQITEGVFDLPLQ